MTLRDLGLGLIRLAPWLEPLGRRVYALAPVAWHDTPTSFLARLFKPLPQVRFIQIGAFDGLAGDPISPLVRTDPRWRGVLIEPQPAVFTQLKANYAGLEDRLAFLQCAVSDADGERPFYFVPRSEIDRLALPAWAGEVASFDEAHIRKHFPETRIEAIETPMRTVARIARDQGLDQVDLVVMDVEGHERTIIDQVDWRGLGVRALLFEHKHMAGEELAHIEALLAGIGFRLKKYGRDMVAWRDA